MSLMHHAYLFGTITCKLDSVPVCISFQRTDVDSDSCPHVLSSCMRDKSRETEWLARHYLPILVPCCVRVTSRISLLMKQLLQPLFFVSTVAFVGIRRASFSCCCENCLFLLVAYVAHSCEGSVLWQPAASLEEPLLGFWGFLQSQSAFTASAPLCSSRWKLRGQPVFNSRVSLGTTDLLPGKA